VAYEVITQTTDRLVDTVSARLTVLVERVAKVFTVVESQRLSSRAGLALRADVSCSESPAAPRRSWRFTTRVIISARLKVPCGTPVPIQGQLTPTPQLRLVVPTSSQTSLPAHGIHAY